MSACIVAADIYMSINSYAGRIFGLAIKIPAFAYFVEYLLLLILNAIVLKRMKETVNTINTDSLLSENNNNDGLKVNTIGGKMIMGALGVKRPVSSQLRASLGAIEEAVAGEGGKKGADGNGPEGKSPTSTARSPSQTGTTGGTTGSSPQKGGALETPPTPLASDANSDVNRSSRGKSKEKIRYKLERAMVWIFLCIISLVLCISWTLLIASGIAFQSYVQLTIMSASVLVEQTTALCQVRVLSVAMEPVLHRKKGKTATRLVPS
jgi:hypothetical protein